MNMRNYNMVRFYYMAPLTLERQVIQMGLTLSESFLLATAYRRRSRRFRHEKDSMGSTDVFGDRGGHVERTSEQPPKAELDPS
jgi:hypothetical protein